jgi:hypothetical protein
MSAYRLKTTPGSACTCDEAIAPIAGLRCATRPMRRATGSGSPETYHQGRPPRGDKQKRGVGPPIAGR